MTLSVAVTACGGGPGDEPEALEGARLVAGTSLERHGLLVVPREGGPAEFRSILDPSVVRWTGRISLPATSAAHSLGRSVLLRHEDGASVYRPSPESLTELPAPHGRARWIGSPEGGAFVAGGWALAVTQDGSREISVAGEVLWAAPAVGNRVVALVETPDGVRLAVWESGREDPTTVQPAASRGPVALAAWGQEVILPGDDPRTLVGWSVPQLESGPSVGVAGMTAVLTTSPSQHRIFAASAAEARLETIDRYEWRRLRSMRLERPLEAVRAGTTGKLVLAFDGSTTWAWEAGDDDAVAMPGEWRDDLPIALPDGRVLAASQGELRLYSGSGEDLGPVEGPADASWLSIRWGPRAPVSGVVSEEPPMEEDPEAAPSADRGVGLTTMGRVSGRTVAAVSPRPDGAVPGEPAPPASSGPTSTVPPGFYAVATSSRQLESMRQLRRALEASGYGTHVLPRRDEANDLWYRLLVGPYPSRAAAEGAARELRRERGIDAWIHEAISGGPRR